MVHDIVNLHILDLFSRFQIGIRTEQISLTMLMFPVVLCDVDEKQCSPCLEVQVNGRWMHVTCTHLGGSVLFQVVSPLLVYLWQRFKPYSTVCHLNICVDTKG